jgi:putative transposase
VRKAKPALGLERSHKIRIFPKAAQERAFHGFAKVVRWTWNTLLRAHDEHVREWIEAGRIGDPPTISGMKSLFNACRPTLAAWTSETGHRDCWSEPFTDMQKAFAAKRLGNAEHPKLKRHFSKKSFYVANDKFSLQGKRIRLPKVGWVRMAEVPRFKGVVRCARISCDAAGRWFASVQFAGVQPEISTGTEAIGVDVGITNTLTLSTGESLHVPKIAKAEIAKMRRLQRSVSRKYEARKARKAVVRKAGGDTRAIVASKREERERLRVAKLHAKIADRRKDWTHKATTVLVRRASEVGIETLSVAGMMRSKMKGIPKALAQSSLGEIHRQIRYKAGERVFNWPRQYPSSQVCSSCGGRKKMPLGVKIYSCEACGLRIDRDANAALNLVPPARREQRGTRATGNAEEQATESKLSVRPVSAESVKIEGGALGRT